MSTKNPYLYRRRPAELEAVELGRLKHGLGPRWALEAVEAEQVRFDEDLPTARISTLEGVMNAGLDSMLVHGSVGELWAIAPEPFRNTYEKVE